MKQSNFCWTEEEIQVAEILLDLGNSVPVSESRSNLSWGSKRRRSNPSHAAAHSLPSPSIHGTETEIQTQVKLEPPSKSPTTPLSFSPSESDEKSKNSKKRKYMEMIEGLTQRRDLLKGEVENVRNYYNKLKAYNLELKLMKQKALTTCLINEGSHSHMGLNKFLNFEMNLAQHYQITAVAHQQPFNLDQMAPGSTTQIGENIHYPSSDGLCHINQVGPVGIPDLNLSPQEAFGVEPSYVNRDLADKRARYAEARRLRRGIIKIKSMKSGVKTLRSR
ncbi:unnamed protein product [Fraxinus pennsylvanica]|uniref:Uncharacterized protein n=1 Tax=Fraxinus pennsylvanica TaxID=56036 RepID=A0AAD2DIU2_9LAMI|nr:unnamed protein product [Fraxinus pennsylvanica]